MSQFLAAPFSDKVLQRLMRLHPKVIDLSLDRMHRILAALGHPERKLPPVIHVAGTNGKGSVIAYLRAMLEAEGLRVHVYSSPHLVRFHERIRLAGELIDEDALLEVLEECERANGGTPITYFEITTAAALLAFSRVPADILLLEVGLGGRLDATNVVEAPLLTVITPVSLDHMQFLGPDIASIAAEKAGILKPGVPAVVAPQLPGAAGVIEARADAIGAPLIEIGFELADGGFAIGGEIYPPPSLAGAHQMANAATAVTAAKTLPGALRPSVESIRRGLREAHWPARLQRLTSGPLLDLLPEGWEVWLDGGHNQAAGEALAAMAAGWRDRPLGVLYGMLNTKAAQAFLAPLVPHAQAFRALAIPGEANSLTAGEAAAAGRAAGAHASEVEDWRQGAAEIAETLGEGPGRLLICGSLYLAGQILREHA